MLVSSQCQQTSRLKVPKNWQISLKHKSECLKFQALTIYIYHEGTLAGSRDSDYNLRISWSSVVNFGENVCIEKEDSAGLYIYIKRPSLIFVIDSSLESSVRRKEVIIFALFCNDFWAAKLFFNTASLQLRKIVCRKWKSRHLEICSWCYLWSVPMILMCC